MSGCACYRSLVSRECGIMCKALSRERLVGDDYDAAIPSWEQLEPFIMLL